MIDEADRQVVDGITARVGRSPAAVIPILQALQEHYGYLPEPALRHVAATTQITAASLEGVSTFYDAFERKPSGRHRIQVCHGTACHVKGAELVTDAFARQLGITQGQETTPDGEFTLGKVACLGCCTLAPAVRVGERSTYAHVAVDAVPGLLADFRAAQQRRQPVAAAPATRRNGATAEVLVGLDSCCVAAGSDAVNEALASALREVRANAELKRVGCVGTCHQVPMVEVRVPGQEPVRYVKVTPKDVPAIVDRHFAPRSLLARLHRSVARGIDRLLTDQVTDGVERHTLDVRDPPVVDADRLQFKIATEHSADLDPLDLDAYLARGGFEALRRCRELLPEQVIDLVERSGLRGRGGGGFPTGRKWRVVRAAAGADKVVICNGDEGDPGAFMDRMILESLPFRVLEGLAIAAHALGARQGIFYIRAEYPHAVQRIAASLQLCKERGILKHGEIEFQPTVARGAGAFVCGEETALIASLEGRRGMPRLRPPFPAERGLFGMPTLINNVETLAMVPWIVRHGPEAFAAMGTSTSKGTKVFALAGKIRRGGLVEVPMGITIRQIVDQLGGGVMPGRKLKAVQIGGPSGGCVPAALCDTPVDYESLQQVGAMMGSGGFVVLDDTDCMVDMARYFLQFTQGQSCGRCAPCRIGTKRLLEILDRIRAGKGRAADLQLIEELAPQVQRTSLCGLGRSAPNPVLSTLQYFREEYEAHLQGHCPAGRCTQLIAYTVTDACIGCTVCAQHCASAAIEVKPYELHSIDQAACNRCGACLPACPVDAIEVKKA